MNTTYIYCDGGFGNRFNSLLSGLFLSWACDYEPKVIWPENNWCRANFKSLFDTDVPSVDFDAATFFLENDTANFMHWNPFPHNLPVVNPMGIYCSISDFVRSLEGKDVFFYTSLICPWVDRNNIHRQVHQVPFQSTILTRASQVIQDHCGSREFKGIHLRSTDHANPADPEKFLNLVAANPDQMFFICSDSADVESKFKQYANTFTYEKTHYVEKLVEGGWTTMITDSTGAQFPFNVDRSSDSVVQAMVDLTILSRSTLVDTDFKSTFLQTAKLLQDCKIA